MSFELDKIVPWGRSFEEYCEMFSLTKKDLSRIILDCGGGPSAFNAVLTAQGGSVISCDPIYCFAAYDIRKRIDETYDEVLEQTISNKDIFIWENIKNPKELGKVRLNAMQNFLNDFPKGKKQGRYIEARLPHLPFDDNQFDLALSSHFLFLYTKMLSLEFHKQALMEMGRTAREIRVFPLLDLSGIRSAYIDDIVSFMEDNGYIVEIRKVNYEFQRNANEMMRIIK